MNLDFEILHLAQIPISYLLPNVLRTLEENKVFDDTTDLEEFMCNGDIFSELLDDNPTTSVLTHFTVEESEQWVALYKHFRTADIQYIHIIKI